MRKQKIVMTSASREMTIAAFKQSDLFLFPSQVECSPIVLFEAAAAGLPFLASSAGNSEEIVKWTGGGKILKGRKDNEGYWIHDPVEAPVQLKEIMMNAFERKSMGQTAYEIWKQKFTWKKLALDYENLYLNLKQSK
jgi:glycosyltransferase involved in cell wall biosynthesis